MPEDMDLLRRYSRNQDAEAFAEIVEEYSGMVYATCLRITNNPHDAQDATQECFLELAKKSRQIRQSLSGWLYSSALNRAKTRVRQAVARRQREKAVASDVLDDKEPVWEEIAPHIDEALTSLPEDLRNPLILHFLQGKKQADIAVELGIDQSTVSRRLHSGIDELRGKLEKTGIVVSVAVLASTLTAHAATEVPVAVSESLGKMAMAGIGKDPASASVIGTVAGKIAVTLVAAAVVAGAGITYRYAARPSVPFQSETPLASLDQKDHNARSKRADLYSGASLDDAIAFIEVPLEETARVKRSVRGPLADAAHLAIARGLLQARDQQDGQAFRKLLHSESLELLDKPGDEYMVHAMFQEVQSCEFLYGEDKPKLLVTQETPQAETLQGLFDESRTKPSASVIVYQYYHPKDMLIGEMYFLAEEEGTLKVIFPTRELRTATATNDTSIALEEPSRREQELERALVWLIQQAEEQGTKAIAAEKELARLRQEGAADRDILNASRQLSVLLMTVDGIEARIEEERQKAKNGGGGEDAQPNQKVATNEGAEAMAIRYANAEIRYRADRVTSLLPILELLQAGHTDVAIEMMEHTLDSYVIHADRSMRSFSFAEHRAARLALIEARAYREKNPRPKVEELGLGDYDPLHDLREKKRREAKVILQGLPNVE